MMTIERFAVPLAISWLAGACQGGGSAPGEEQPDAASPVCSSFAACGGDPVGQWEMREMCLGEAPDCPGATTDVSAVHVSGRFIFGADMTYSADVTFDGTLTLELPLACLPSGTSCDEIVEDEITCAVATDLCQCQVPAPSFPPEDGTWSADQTSLTTTPADGGTAPATAEYCVTAEVLQMRSRRADRSLVLTRVDAP